jgi:hypothetical protein
MIKHNLLWFWLRKWDNRKDFNCKVTTFSVFMLGKCDNNRDCNVFLTIQPQADGTKVGIDASSNQGTFGAFE